MHSRFGPGPVEVFLILFIAFFVLVFTFVKVRAHNKMTLHSNGFFRFWTASGCIDHPQMACFAFLARRENARFRCYDSFF